MTAQEFVDLMTSKVLAVWEPLLDTVFSQEFVDLMTSKVLAVWEPLLDTVFSVTSIVMEQWSSFLDNLPESVKVYVKNYDAKDYLIGILDDGEE